MDIEFDARKADSNFAKHGISFDEAASALFDPLAMVVEDHDAEEESRWVLVGMSDRARLLTVIYTLRHEDKIRLISARKATRKEAKQYA